MPKSIHFNHKPVADIYTYIHTYIHTYIQLQPQTKTPLCLHDYEPHVKAFGSQSVDVLHTTPKPLIIIGSLKVGKSDESAVLILGTSF